jgi:DMSO/TMAO reductase YedYZ molybdopterin-dependent catalytic subunit
VDEPGTSAGPGAGAAAGLAGAGAALGLSAVLHTVVPAIPFPPVAVAQAVIRAAPGGVDAFFIGSFQHGAKTLAVVGAGVGFLVVSALLGLLLPWVRRMVGGRTAVAATLLAIPPYGLAVAGAAPMPGDAPRWVSALVLLPVFGVSVAVAARAFGRLGAPRVRADPDATRREVVRALWVGGAGFLLGWANLGRLVFRRPDPGRRRLEAARVSPAPSRSPAPGDAAFDRIPGLSPEVTSNDRFYVVNEELFAPDVDPETWALEVGGLVDRPYRLSYAELTSMPAVEQFLTLECISNRIGGHLISTARWTGVPLPDILRRAGVRSGALEVVSRSVDGFADSIPLERAMERTTLVAIGMNGRVLPRAHGFPARLLVPGYYGMKQPKWLGRIEVVERPYRGFWEQRGWIKEAVVRTMSRIDVPQRGASSAGRITVAGVAFAGDRGISRVEVSTDGGRTFRDARLKSPLSDFTWRLWRFQFAPGGPGPLRIMVRATDGTGATQTSAVTPPEYSGATGWHEVDVVEQEG